MDADLLEAYADVMEGEGQVTVTKSIGGHWRVRITSRGYLEARSLDDGTSAQHVGAALPCPPVVPGTYNGRVTVDGRPAPDGTPIRALIDDTEWGSTATSGGRYALDVPQRPPTMPPCFLGGTVAFGTGSLIAAQSAAWGSGLHDLDLTFAGGGGVASPLIGRRKFSADYLRRARDLYVDATRRFLDGRYPEVVSAVQEALELALKAIFMEAEMEPPRHHRIDERKFEQELQDLRAAVERWYDQGGGWETAGLGRLVFYANFWGQAYEAAKYGSQTLVASPSELFGRAEAELALSHLGEAVGRLDSPPLRPPEGGPPEPRR